MVATATARTLFLATAAVGLAYGSAPLAAHAASVAAATAPDIPGGPNTRATLKITDTDYAHARIGTFDGPGDSDWYRVKLLARHDYTLAAANLPQDGTATLAIRNAAGGVLTSTPTDFENVLGFEFRAPSTGTYFVEIRNTGPVGLYALSLSHDCAGSVRTACLLRDGQTRRAAFAFDGDQDWYRAILTAGVPYVVTFVPDGLQGYQCIQVRDQAGEPVSGGYQCGAPAVIDFTPTASGAYFVEAAEADEDVQTNGYALTLTRAGH